MKDGEEARTEKKKKKKKLEQEVGEIIIKNEKAMGGGGRRTKACSKVGVREWIGRLAMSSSSLLVEPGR